MKLALTGLATSGKSTLMRALAGRRIAVGKGSTDASQALLTVPDQRIDKLSAMYSPQKTIYAQITFIDPAPPMAKADDPTTKLPPELRQAEGLLEVVRNFDGGLGAPDVAGDHQAFNDELIINDLITVERRLERIAEERKRGREIDQEEIGLLEQCKEQLNAEKPLRLLPQIPGHPKLKGFGLLTAKPLVVVANNEEDDPEPPDLGPELEPVVVRAAIEAELVDLDDDERAEFMDDLGLSQSALDRLIAAGYRAVDVISFFTVGEDEVRAWTVRRGAFAPQAAGVIHSDMEKGFIRAEVIRYEDLIAQGSEAAGKDYLVQDGDIFHVRFNV